MLVLSIAMTSTASAVGTIPNNISKDAYVLKTEYIEVNIPKQVTVKEYARQGLSSSEWKSLNYIISHESSWNAKAQNPHSVAYGLFQFLDSTWKTVGCRKTSDPYLQINCGKRYILQRYKSYNNAEIFWRKNHWY